MLLALASVLADGRHRLVDRRASVVEDVEAAEKAVELAVDTSHRRGDSRVL